jgi:alkanesulfonate monooxygenase SsuD/methylene tetrahydromethanopterin reductase-like flavin-dependent oxidoreductase (luciferase family)
MTTAKRDIPITIAAKSAKMMQIAARFADIWETSYLTPVEFSSKNKKFNEMIKLGISDEDSGSRGHPKRSIELDVIIAESKKELEDKKKILAIERGVKAYSQVLQKGLVGTPNEIQSKISKYIKLGIDQFFLAFQDPLDLKSMELFMQSVKGVT